MIKRYEGNGRMSRVVEYKDTIYLCGQVSDDPEKNIQEQTKEVLEKINNLLKKYGSDSQHILSTTIYLKNMSDFSMMNEIWDAWVEDGDEPARACVEAKLARDTILIEMSVIAAKN